MSAPDNPLAQPLAAAIMALRSFQYGNASTEFAESTADGCEAELAKVGFPAGFIAKVPAP